MKKYVFTLFFLISNFFLYAQDGSIDLSFNPGLGTDDIIYSCSIQNDGKILVGGQFTSFNGITRNGISRLNENGSLDTTFNPGSGVGGLLFNYVRTIAIQSDGKIVIGGDFSNYNGSNINNIARLNSNGSLDTTFNVGLGTNSSVYTASIQSNGKIILGGDFSFYNGTIANRLIRLNSDGSIDTSFNTGLGTNTKVLKSIILNDGKIIISGTFNTFNGINKGGIARLNSNGSIDTSFNIGTGANNSVITFAIQSDGKIIIGGYFTSFNGTTQILISRLNIDGSVDTSFNPGISANNSIQTSNIQNDGKIIIGGYFTTFNGISINRIARLNTDGSVDLSFNPGSGANLIIIASALQNDGRILIGGSFTSYNGINRNYIARLNITPLNINNTNIESSELDIYPNPALNIINIKSKDKIENIEIYNSVGMLVKSETTNNFYITSLKSGIYFIHIFTKNGIITKKIVKE